VKRNPPANLPPQVQVLAQSKNPSGDSGGADRPKSLLSSYIPGGKTRSASQCQDPPQSRGGWRNFFQRGKSNRVNPSEGATSDSSPPVAHSSGKPSECAATTPPLPSFISPLGGDIGGSPGAHSPGEPLGFVPSSAPSSSSKLGSAATPALSLPTCPSGHDKGGTKRSEEMLDLSMVYLRGAHLRHLGVPFEQSPLFSHIPPALLLQAVGAA